MHEYERLQKVMGEDYWSYGAHENKHALETLMRYSFEQGLAPRKMPLEEMFAKSIYELSKVDSGLVRASCPARCAGHPTALA